MKYNKFPISFGKNIKVKPVSWPQQMECNVLFVCRFHMHKRESNIILNLFWLLHASTKANSAAQLTASFRRTVQPLPNSVFRPTVNSSTEPARWLLANLRGPKTSVCAKQNLSKSGHRFPGLSACHEAFCGKATYALGTRLSATCSPQSDYRVKIHWLCPWT